ncbi:MAG: hypothetical protein AB7U41_01300 [Dongiaceae bacterium]
MVEIKFNTRFSKDSSLGALSVLDIQDMEEMEDLVASLGDLPLQTDGGLTVYGYKQLYRLVESLTAPQILKFVQRIRQIENEWRDAVGQGYRIMSGPLADRFMRFHDAEAKNQAKQKRLVSTVLRDAWKKRFPVLEVVRRTLEQWAHERETEQSPLLREAK